MVTPGEVNDSPYLRKMVGTMPPGSGDVLGDPAYGGVKNRNIIRDSGCRPIIYPKFDASPHEFNAKVEMLRFRDEYPGAFYGILHIRNNIESVFSLLERFGGRSAHSRHTPRP